MDSPARRCGTRGRPGDIIRIRQYCETDVLNTYLIYLRFELMRGRFTPALYAEEVARVKSFLAAGTEPHLGEFLRAWEALTPEAAAGAAAT